MARLAKSKILTFVIFTACLAGIAPAKADWRTDLGTFRIGMLESEATKLSPGELERVRAAYADALKMPVEIIRARDFSALVDAHASSRLDYAIYSAAAYSSAVLACECVEPIANAVMADGTSGTRTMLFLADGVSLATIAGSKGVAISKSSVTAYGTVLAGLPVAIAGFKPDAPWLIDAQSPDDAVSKFKDGLVDGFFANVPANRNLGNALLPDDPLTRVMQATGHGVKAVWASDPIAGGPHAVRQNLDNQAKKLLLGFLEGLSQADPDLNDILLPEGAVSFHRINASAYASAIAATKVVAAMAGKPAQ